MSPMILLAALAVASGAPPPDVPPPAHADEVVVKARRPIVVTANVCPPPDPARYPAEQAPRVVDSYPGTGAAVTPGFVRVRVTFDAPMSCFSEVTADGGESDPCQPEGTWELPDRRSFVMQCRLEPSTAYRMRFRRREGRGFVGLSGRDAAPFDLAFITTGGPPVASMTQAAALDPGAPGTSGVRAYVSCDDHPAPSGRRDCHRTVIHPPGE